MSKLYAQVLMTLRDWEPRFSREELLSSVVNALSRQERVIELWTLVKNTMMKDIMPVSMHVIDQVLANLLRKRMKTEQLNVRCGRGMTSSLLKVLKSGDQLNKYMYSTALPTFSRVLIIA